MKTKTLKKAESSNSIKADVGSSANAAMELIAKRFAAVEDLCQKVASGECTLPQALLAMSFLGQTKFE